MRRWTLRIVLVLGLLAAGTGRVAAHPLGNFTVNQFSRVEVGRSLVRVDYVVDMAEIPAFQASQAIDSNGDGQADPGEQQRYLDAQAAVLAGGLQLKVDGTQLPLRVVGREISLPAGQGGLSTLRLALRLEADRPASGERARLSYRVTNFEERLGWREIVAVAGDGLALADSSALAQSISDELRSYPEDALQSPPDMRSAELTALPGAPGSAAEAPGLAAGQTAARADDQLAALVATRDLTPSAAALALLLALVLGAGHALTPGHGKTIVAAYLVGARGTARHALFLGMTTTITHTAGVFLLGFVTLAVSQYILPEQLYPWLELLSGALVVVIGVALFRSRLAGLLRRRSGAPHDHSHDMLGADHEHGPDTHTHDPAQLASGRSVTWRSLLALGVSGGLIPCPSALVVLLGAIALGRVGFGLLLILAFSAGLAAVLTGLGLLLVYARSLFNHLPTSGLVVRALPVASAALVTLAGCAICVGGLVQAGLLRV